LGLDAYKKQNNYVGIFVGKCGVQIFGGGENLDGRIPECIHEVVDVESCNLCIHEVVDVESCNLFLHFEE
jgi:hypothetical protein